MMIHLGFHSDWIGKIMACMRLVSYHVEPKEKMLGPIKPSKGVLQGDSLSPFLFILCAEGPSKSIQALERQGHIHGYKVARGALVSPHLFFADDNYCFFRADVDEAQQVKNCLLQ